MIPKFMTVEYLSLGDTVSSAGRNFLKDHMNKAQAGVGDAMVPDASNVKADLINAFRREGFNVPSAKKAHIQLLWKLHLQPHGIKGWKHQVMKFYLDMVYHQQKEHLIQ